MDKDNQIRLEDAKWFAQEVGRLNSENQARVLGAKTTADLRPIFGEGADRYWKALESWKIESSLGNQIQIPHPGTENITTLGAKESKNLTDTAKSAAGVTAIGTFITADRIVNRDYYKFKKERDEYVKEQVKKWNDNPDDTYAKSESGAQNRAINEFHDIKLGESTDSKMLKKYQKWAEKSEEEDLQRALKRKEILEKDNPKRNDKELNKFLDEQGIKNPEKTHKNPDSPSPDEVEKRLSDANKTAEQQQALNETNVRLKKLQDDFERIRQEENKKSGIIIPRQVVHHPVPGSYTPSQFTRPIFRTRGRRTPGGRAGGIVKGGAKKITKTAAKKGAKKAATAILSNPYVLAAIGIAVGILLLIIIIATFICELTAPLDFIRPDWLRAICTENTTAEEFPPPPKGVTIVKTGPSVIANNEQILYAVKVTYDPAEADIPLADMTLIDLPNYDHTISSAETPYTTTSVAPNEGIAWKLSDFMTDNSGIQEHTFSLTVLPGVLDDVVFNVAYISVDGAGAGAGGTISPTDDGLGPGEFKVPFRCDLSYRSTTYSGHSPYSLDINRGDGADDRGDPVYASADGVVFDYIASNGQMVIRHEGSFYTLYAHMQNVTVGERDKVTAGQKIGEIGDTGAPGQYHLHINHAQGGSPVVYSNRIKVCFQGYGCNPASVSYNDRSRVGTVYNNGCP